MMGGGTQLNKNNKGFECIVINIKCSLGFNKFDYMHKRIS